MGSAVDLMAAHHLVADLNEIPGVEERVAAEQGIADGFGVRVERAVARQSRGLCVLPYRLWLRHDQPWCRFVK